MKSEMYRKGWIDFNKNGVKDVYEDPSVSSMREQNVAENCWLLENIQTYIYTAS